MALWLRWIPGSVCSSINRYIGHGIPSANVILQDGDIFTIDTVLPLTVGSRRQRSDVLTAETAGRENPVDL